ncbi:MAG: Sec-independent protein translocase protein TatB [Methylococcales bacterium]|jgi:sec-independent protein translocase protein TatB|nr:Sec-independent protein translocase protein TatB [Methylococcales bacterium]
MFDVGFWELALVGLICLVVVGPQRLPELVRVAGFWIGKARRTSATLKQEIRDELYAEELRQTIENHLPANEMQGLIDETSSALEEPSEGNGAVRVGQETGKKAG